MDEPDVATFESMMLKFVSQLLNDSDTAAFGQFFKTQYATSTHSWAYC